MKKEIRIRRLYSIVCLVLFSVMAVSSVGKKATYNKSELWLPPEFDPQNVTLLIEKHPLSKKQNRKMIKFLKDAYPYNFEVLSKEEIDAKTGAFSDSKKYPWAVLWVERSTDSYNASGNRTGGYNLAGYFLDRNTGKGYNSSPRVNNYGQKAYRPFFNAITKKYK